ncbi:MULTISPECIES: golvesin C-terminal-like domain-containing protein [Paenibacillus]|uniref:golvesin C-terminal-like domain-containing protein n=1 Tax=Paenibacillus TaxID=44249 RepID=UPI0022B8C127|nr:cellulase family glycosylhydrolase [Paenibacillus caseinilyticus]MCZ8521162.1 cellulase family glycosylhydrolase [Paenibacillus caseinilyticus]
MNKWLKFISTALLVVIFVTVFNGLSFPGRAEAGFASFITRSGDQLMDGDTPYRFIGSNHPFLERSWMDVVEVEDSIRAARLSGIDVIRTYPFEVRMKADPPGTPRHVLAPGQYNEKAFQLMDRVLYLAAQYNVRLIVPFVDSHNYIGGVEDWAGFRGKTKVEFYSDPQVKQDFKAFITYVLNRKNKYTGALYKDDPTILAWQLGNELGSSDTWTTEMAAHVKSIDTNHLLADGGYVRAQGIKANALKDPNIDIIDPHIYGYHQVDLGAKLAEWRKTTQGKKALMIGEFGDYSAAQIEQLLSTVQSNGTTGALFWGTMHHHRQGGWHWQPANGWSYLRYPGFSTGDWANETTTINLMRSYAYSIRGGSVPPWPAPETPVMFPSDSVHTLSWLGASGVSSYDIERAEAPGGPWLMIASQVTDDVTVPRHHTFTVPLFDDGSAAVGGSYYYRIRAKNPDGILSPYSNVVGPIVPKKVIVIDQGDSGYTETGTWGDSDMPGSYGGLSRFSSTNGSTVQWTPNIPQAGYYNVYVRYPLHKDSEENVLYTLYNGVNNNSYVDQTTIASGQWRLLETVYLRQGTGNYVKFKVTTTANHRADAVMFEPVYYGDGFQDGNTNSWTLLSGSWSLATDERTKVMKQTGGGIAEALGPLSPADLSVTSAIKAHDTGSQASTGLIARAAPDMSSYYTLRINYELNKIQLYKKVNDTWTRLAEKDWFAAPGTWYILRLELKGNALKGYVNGVEKLSATDTTLIGEGHIGLRTVNQTAVFDSVMVDAK